jgi:hypothetical protein
MPDNLHNFVPGMNRRRTPVSDYLIELLRKPMAEFVQADQGYEYIFDLFEYICGVLTWHLTPDRMFRWAPIGRNRWSRPQLYSSDGPTSISQSGISGIAIIVFGSVEAYTKAKTEYDQWVLQNTQNWY